MVDLSFENSVLKGISSVQVVGINIYTVQDFLWIYNFSISLEWVKYQSRDLITSAE